LPPARVAALAFDKLDVEKGMEARGPQGELRWDDVQNQLRGQPQDPVREDMLATWTEEARRRMPEAIRQVMAPREGYEEPVDIPACPAGAVEAAVTEAVQQG